MTAKYDDSNLKIQLLRFDRPTELTERYFFLEMSTLQATTLLPPNRKIVSLQIVACANDDKYLDEAIANAFHTIGDFNSFFQQNSQYYFHNCNLELESETQICSHDDGEVSIAFKNDSPDKGIIGSIFEKFNLK